jgi:MFS family permease
MDSMMTVVALPAMADDLGASLAAKQWVVAAYLLALGSPLLLGGAVGDALDRWRVFAAGTAAVGTAPPVCAVASTAPVLIAARLVQGAVAASMVPGALVVVTSAYAGRHRSSAIAT